MHSCVSERKTKKEHEKDECKNNKNVIHSCRMCAAHNIGTDPAWCQMYPLLASFFCVYSFLICLSSKMLRRPQFFIHRFFVHIQFEIISSCSFLLPSTDSLTPARASETLHSLFSVAIKLLKIKCGDCSATFSLYGPCNIYTQSWTKENKMIQRDAQTNKRRCDEETTNFVSKNDVNDKCRFSGNGKGTTNVWLVGSAFGC